MDMWEELRDGQETDRQRKGDGINRVGDNKMAMVYAGKDIYPLSKNFLNSKPEAADARTMLEQINNISETGLTLDNGMHFLAQWLQGGDLKLHMKMCAQNGHASRNPCTCARAKSAPYT
jgi:hypothetical protein